MNYSTCKNLNWDSYQSHASESACFCRPQASKFGPAVNRDTRDTVTFKQNRDTDLLAYNQDNGSVRLQRNRSERKRLQKLQLLLTNVSSNMARLTLAQRTFNLKEKFNATKVFARFSSAHGYIPPSASRRLCWFLELRTR